MALLAYGYGGMTFFGQSIGGAESKGIPVGMLAGAAGVVFAYLGFDAVSTQAEEAKNPGRDVPIGILGSLVVCTLLYILMAAVLTGLVPFEHIDKNAPVSSAHRGAGQRVVLAPGETPPENAVVKEMATGVVKEVQVGSKIAKEPETKRTYAIPTTTMSESTKWFAGVIVTLGALTGITSVLIVMMLGQPRIFLAMARDGLSSQFLRRGPPDAQDPLEVNDSHRCHRRHRGQLVAAEHSCRSDEHRDALRVRAGLHCGVDHARRPDRPRPFRVPFSPVFPIIGIALCMMLMMSLPGENWLRLIVWLVVGFCLYFTYGVSHSRLRARRRLAMSESNNDADSVTAEGFHREIGLFDATMLVMGTMIGSGIFIVSTDIAATVGSVRMAPRRLGGDRRHDDPRRALLCGTRRHDARRRRPVRLSQARVSPVWGFLYGWTLFMVIQTGSIAAVAVAFTKFLGVFAPAGAPTWPSRKAKRRAPPKSSIEVPRTSRSRSQCGCRASMSSHRI